METASNDTVKLRPLNEAEKTIIGMLRDACLFALSDADELRYKFQEAGLQFNDELKSFLNEQVETLKHCLTSKYQPHIK